MEQNQALVPVAQAQPEPQTSGAINVFGSQGNFAAAQRMAKALSASSLVPAAYQGEKGVANCILALELASRVGASPLMVMQNLHIVQGRPSWSSSFLIATVNASGRFTPLRFEWRGTEGTMDWGCRAISKDKASGERCEGSWITMQMAKDEGWSGKSGSKWKTMPQQMFQYRAAAFWTRVFAPEMALGILSTEEVRDMSVGDAVAPIVPLPEVLTPGTAADLEAALAVAAEVVEEARDPGSDDV